MTGGFDLADILRPFVEIAANRTIDIILDRVVPIIVERTIDALDARHLLRDDGKAPPPIDEEAEDRVLSSLLFASVDNVHPSATPDLFHGPYNQRVALVLRRALDQGAPLSPDELFAELCRSWPQCKRTWAAIVARVQLEAAATHDPAEDIEHLRLLADMREHLRASDEHNDNVRGGRLSRDDMHRALLRQAARFEPKGQP